EVAPRLVAARARLELRHVYAVLREDLQACHEVAGPVVRGEDQARLVLPARLGRPLLVAEDEETREVEAQVLDALGHDLEAVRLGGAAAGDRGAARLPGGALQEQLRRAGRVVVGHRLEAVPPDEALALLQRLRVAVSAPPLLEA